MIRFLDDGGTLVHLNDILDHPSRNHFAMINVSAMARGE